MLWLRVVYGAVAAALSGAPLLAQGNGALRFGPDDVVQVPASVSIDSITTQITLEAWIRPTDSAARTIVRRNMQGFVTGGPLYILRLEAYSPISGQA
jgi:hypothetical protein